MQKEDLHAYVPAIATPFDDKGEIMEDAFVNLFEFLLSRGRHAFALQAITAKAGR